MAGDAPEAPGAAPAVLAARLAAGKQVPDPTVAAAAEAPPAAAEAPPAEAAAALLALPGTATPGGKPAKATPRGQQAEEPPCETTAAGPDAVPLPAPTPPAPPPQTFPAHAPPQPGGEAPARSGGLARPEPAPAAAAAPDLPAAPQAARAAEPRATAEASAAPDSAAPPREAAPPPPAQAPPPPDATTATAPAAPARHAPHTSPAHQVAPVVVAVALGQGSGSSLTVRLSPGELGQVEVRIERPADGSAAQVKVVAERPETLALLQRDAPELGRALQQAGIQQDGCRLSFSLGGGQDQGNAPGDGAQRQAGQHGQPGWGGRQGRFAEPPPLPPPRQAMSLLDLSI